MTYFLITGSEDGTQIREFKSDASVKKEIAELGLSVFRKDASEDPNYWGEDECVLIRGEIVLPKPKKVVSDWEL